MAEGKKKMDVPTRPAVQGDLFSTGIPASALEPIREELRNLLNLLR